MLYNLKYILKNILKFEIIKQITAVKILDKVSIIRDGDVKSVSGKIILTIVVEIISDIIIIIQDIKVDNVLFFKSLLYIK